MDYVNANAPHGAHVAILQPFDSAANFARPDLSVGRPKDAPGADYLLVCNYQGDLTLGNLGEFPVAYVVSRSGVVLSVVLLPGGAQREGLSSIGNETARVAAPRAADAVDRVGLSGKVLAGADSTR
jgi:hypothetical protein